MARLGITKLDFIEILKNKAFHVSEACKAAGISRDTFYRWLQESKEFSQQVDNAKQGQVDTAKAILWELVLKRDFQALKYYLEHNDKEYVEKIKMELTGKDGEPIETKNEITIYIPDNNRNGKDRNPPE